MPGTTFHQEAIPSKYSTEVWHTLKRSGQGLLKYPAVMTEHERLAKCNRIEGEDFDPGAKYDLDEFPALFLQGSIARPATLAYVLDRGYTGMVMASKMAPGTFIGFCDDEDVEVDDETSSHDSPTDSHQAFSEGRRKISEDGTTGELDILAAGIDKIGFVVFGRSKSDRKAIHDFYYHERERHDVVVEIKLSDGSPLTVEAYMWLEPGQASGD